VITVALKGLFGRKLRAFLTAIAIVLGVAMVSGTYVLTDTIKAAFNTVFTEVYQNTDAVITGKSAIGNSNNNGNSTVPSFPESLLARVRQLPGVAEAEGGIDDQSKLVGRNGKVIASGGPGLAFSVNPAGNQRFNPLELLRGRQPLPFGDRLGVDLGHDQRHVGLHAEARGVVDHHRPGLGCARRELRRHLGAGRGQHDIDAVEVVGFEVLHPEDVILAKGDLPADRARRGQRHDFVGGKIALGEGGQDFAPDIAGGADHRYFETHVATPRSKGGR